MADRRSAGQAVPASGPVVVVSVAGQAWRLDPLLSYVVGRDPGSDIVVDDPRVSWRHAVLRCDGDGWVLEDRGSKNGTFRSAHRVSRLRISADCVLRLGSPDDGPDLFFRMPGGGLGGSAGEPAGLGVDRQPSGVTRVGEGVIRIGRAPGNDVVVSDLSVSRYHAELRSRGGGRFEAVDLGSHNGMFINGRQVRSALLTGADVIGIGPATFRLAGGELREFLDQGNVSVLARDLSVQDQGGKVLLDHVSFPLGERRLVAIIGPSGAGKSTLLGALTGMRPATGGSVLYDGRDLYQHYAELRHRIGFVPQDNILHSQLSARRALGYAAELRFPGDTSASERAGRVEEVLGELGLAAHAQTRTGSLSGGQRKRVNVALELLTKPSLLFLDEPTSGLDPGLDKSVMRMLSGLAHDGRTVIVVTHSVASLDVCDDLLVLSPGGRLAFFGPPAEGLAYFGMPDWAEVFTAFQRDPGRDWGNQFRQSTGYRHQVASRLQAEPAAAARPPDPPPSPRSRPAQLSTLCRRYLAVIGSDRTYLAVLAVLPVALGLLLRAVPARQGLSGHANPDAESLLLVLAIGACLTGAAGSVRELVAERAIFLRERAAGLSPGAYLCSKLIVLGVISCAQAVILVAIGLAGRPMPAHGSFLTAFPLAELMIAVGILAIASMTMGLVVSAVVSTAEKTMPLLVLLSMAQVVLSGGVIALAGKTGLEQLAWLSPSRWGFGATASTVSLAQISPPTSGRPDPLWAHNPSTWLTDMGLQLLLALLLTITAWRRTASQQAARQRW